MKIIFITSVLSFFAGFEFSNFIDKLIIKYNEEKKD